MNESTNNTNTIYNMAQNISRVNESQKAVADGFAELTKLLSQIDELRGQARVIWNGIEQKITELNKLGS
jgi:hypothetical protein